MFFNNIEQQLINTKLKAYAPMTERTFFEQELTRWEHSPKRREMLDGVRYYDGEHDILRRVRTGIGKDGEAVELKNLPNNRIVDNQYAKHVDQKKNYLLGKPVTFTSDNAEYAEKVGAVLSKRFMRTLKNAGLDALNCGISWLYPYYDAGELRFREFPGYEVLPFWKDSEHTELDCACRLYLVEVYVGTERRILKKVNIFKPDGVYNYDFTNGSLVPDGDNPKSSYAMLADSGGGANPLNWDRLPLIAIKQGAREIPMLRRARGLQDAINALRSDFVNNMEEDIHTTILVLKNYDGQDLGEFRQNLAAYGAVKVRTVDGADGGIDALKIEVNSENYTAVLDMLKAALIENMRSFDGKDERLNGNANRMNIQSLYMDMDLDANDTETELQAAFEEILWFVNAHLANTGQGNFDGEQIDVIFNRDILVNEGEAIDNCAKSVGIISDETIVGQHPWVDDPQAELERLKKQKDEAQKEFEARQYSPFEGESGEE